MPSSETWKKLPPSRNRTPTEGPENRATMLLPDQLKRGPDGSLRSTRPTRRTAAGAASAPASASDGAEVAPESPFAPESDMGPESTPGGSAPGGSPHPATATAATSP